MALLHKNLLGIKKDEAYSCAGTDDILDVFNRHQTGLEYLLDLIVEESFRTVNLQKVKKANILQNYCEI